MYSRIEETSTNHFNARILIVVLFSATIIASAILYILFRTCDTPPNNFPTDETITISEGMSIKQISEMLNERNVVRSSFFLYISLMQDNSDTLVQAGTYTFTQPLSTREVREAITRGDYATPLTRITLPEGFRARDIYTYLPDDFESEDISFFEEREGYLFPETYFISPHMSAGELRDLLTKTSEERLSKLMKDASTTLTRDEVIVLASIIEREAKGIESKYMVSGILHNRLRAHMPLQVDAVFDYTLDKTSAELTREDLEINSPFNTYKNVGLPPNAISNPGEDSIRAVLQPTPSKYFYYLTDDSGSFHYAKTFEEHKRNKIKYLK